MGGWESIICYLGAWSVVGRNLRTGITGWIDRLALARTNAAPFGQLRRSESAVIPNLPVWGSCQQPLGVFGA